MSQVSSQSVPQSSIPSTANGQAGKISRETLLNYLVQAAKTMRRVELGIGIAGWLCTIVVFLLTVILIDHWLWPLNTFARFAVLFFLIAWSAWWIPRRILPLLFQSIHPEHAARKIESQFPEMKESLISWLQLSTSENTAPKGVLAVVGRFAVRNLGGQDSSNIVDSANLIRIAALLFGFLLTGTVYLFVSPKSGTTSLSRMLMPWANIAPAARVRILNVAPGDTTITQGTNVPIAVTVRGMHKGDSVSLRYDLSDGQQVGQLLKMNEELEGINYRLDFGKSFGGIHQPLQYWIQAGDATAGPFSLRVQVVPIVAIDRLEYDYPAYTKLKSRSIQQDGTIEAPEGTRVRLFAHANQPMAKSRLEFDPVIDNGLFLGASQILDLETQETQLNGSWMLQLDKKKSNPSLSTYRVKATNSLGESNGDPVIYKIKVIGDLAPEVRLQSDLQASVDVAIDGSIDIEMRAVDPDYGLISLSATGKLMGKESGKETKPLFEIKSFESKSGRTGQVVEVYSFVPSEHNLNVDDKIEFRAIATDNRCQVGTDVPEPNQSSSTPIQIRIVASKNAPNQKSNASEPNADSKKETQGSKPNTPGKTNSPEKKTRSQSQKNPNAKPQDGKTDSPQDGKTDSGSNEKKDPQDTNKEPSEDNDSKSDEQTDNKGNDGKSGGKQSSSGKQEKNNSGGKKGSQSNESGSESSDPGDSQEGSESTGSNSSGSQSKPTKNSTQSSSTDGSTNQGEGSDAGDEGSEQSIQSGTNAGKGKASLSKRDPSSQASDEDNGLSNPEHDGEKFEVIDRMRQEEEKSQKSDGKQSDGKQSDGKQSDGKQSDGKQGDGKQSDGKQGDGKQSDGKQSDGKQGDGKQSDGKQSDGKQSDGKQSDGKQGDGKQGDGKQGDGKQGDGKQGDGKQSDGKQSDGKQSDGKQSDGTQSDGKQGDGKQSDDKQGDGKQSDGKQSDDKQSDGKQSDDKQSDGKQSDGKQNDGKQGDGKQSDGKQNDGKQGDGKQGDGKQSDGDGDSKSPAGKPKQGDPSKSKAGSASAGTNNSGSAGSGGSLSDGGDASSKDQADPVNQDYANKTTDLALDYLKRQKDQPDPELLRRLNWTKDDMQKFIDRWTEAKELAKTDPNKKRELDATLKSLGLRPAKSRERTVEDKDDDLKGLLEEGSRVRPPESLRERFEQFRKAAGKL